MILALTLFGAPAGRCSLLVEAEGRPGEGADLAPRIQMGWTKSPENERRAAGRMALSVGLTLVTVYFLLSIAFHSGKLAALILLNVPYAASGGLVALALAGLNLSTAAAVGFVALFGMAIQNSVIMVTRIRELRGEGLDLTRAVKEGATSRVRPMVITALAALFGLLPLCLSAEVGAETARPFAIVVIGGLMTDSLLTLFMLPMLYPLFEPAPTKNERRGRA